MSELLSRADTDARIARLLISPEGMRNMLFSFSY